MISIVMHPNLVQLIGCCVEDKNWILLYEYLENNSLASVLLRSKGKGVYLDWPKRVAICMGTTSGLAFLHEEAKPQIVHRDIKASNILLDENFHPKIGDFGLAKLFPDNVTHISTRVAGTVGYLAPEYAMLGQLTKKADVYSFGVVILEIVSGKSSSMAAFGVDLLVLVEWAWQLKEQERLLDLVILAFKSRTYWESIFPPACVLYDKSSTSVIIDPIGRVSQCDANNIFFWYGARAYPFTDERRSCLLSEDEEAQKHPSITELLASPECNHLINNKNQLYIL